MTARFSKMKELADSVRKTVYLAFVIQNITDEEMFDQKTTKAVIGISVFGKMQTGKEISSVFNFDDGKYPVVSYLDENYFRCDQENFIGQSYVLCKVIRKISKGKSIKLDELFNDIRKMPLDRS